MQFNKANIVNFKNSESMLISGNGTTNSANSQLGQAMQEIHSIFNSSENLRFRRQYLIAPKPVELPFISNSAAIANGHIIYYHPDLSFTQASGNQSSLFLLGDLYDYRNPTHSNQDILGSLVKFDLQQLFQQLDHYMGRYVMIYSSADENVVFNDAAATRKIFYSRHEGATWCASTPHLLAKVLGYEFTRDAAVLDYYRSDDFIRMDGANIGNTTIYDQILQIQPNHYFRMSDALISRYWPYKPIEHNPVPKIIERCSEMLKGYILAAAHRHSLMIPFTAGSDSRLIVAASRQIQRDVFYYINKTDDLNYDHPDIRVPQKLLQQNNLKLDLLEVSSYVDPEFEKIYFENNPLGSRKYLPVIYNYYLNFQDKLNLPGNFIHVAKNAFPNFLNGELSGEYLVHLLHLEPYDMARKYYSQWLKDVSILRKKYNLRILDLLYWEGRFANWGSQVQMDKDIAQDELIIYNSRAFIELMLSVDEKYRMKPRYLLMAGMINKLWPELMNLSFNPSIKNQVLSLLDQYGFYKKLVRAKAKLHL